VSVYCVCDGTNRSLPEEHLSSSIQPIIAAGHGSEFAPVCSPFTMDRGIDLVPNTLS